ILLSPFFAWLWVKLGPRQPSSPAKFALALLFVGMAFVLLMPAGAIAQGGVKISPLWLVAVYFIEELGELCLSPVGLSVVTKLAPKQVVGLMMGVFFLSNALGNKLAGWSAGFISTTPLPTLFGVTAAVTLGAAAVMNPADHPASLLPRAFERKNTPIISPTTCLGASLVTTDSPTGLKHSSPSSSMKYTATSHRGLILTPPWAIAPAGMSSTKASPTNSSARANFAGEDGCRGPSFTHNHAKMGDKRITNAAWTDTNQDAYSLMPSSSRWTYRSANSASVDPACS